jgi:hypothetical protein
MRVRRNLAALLAAPFLLSACGGGGSSVADPPVSSAPPSSAPTTQPPAHETPEHFIRRWAEAEKRMENTGKTGPYLRMSRGCGACQRLANDIQRFYSDGGYAKWGGWQILSISREATKGSSLVFDVRVNSRATTYRESSGGAIKHLQGGPATHQLTIQSASGGWRVTQKAQLAG